MKTKFIAALLGLAFVSFTACKSKEEQARENALEERADAQEAAAKQVRKEGEVVADMKEAQADALKKEGKNAADAMNESADATRKAAEHRADELENAADKTRDQK